MKTTITDTQKGFTLIELIIAMGLGMFVLSMIYSFFYLQQKTYLNQTEITSVQQELTTGMHIIEREIRMAGYDITGSAKAGFVQATANRIKFTMDLNDDGDLSDAGESITYAFYDSNGDGSNDAIGRQDDADTTPALIPLIEDVDAFNVVYLNGDGNPTGILSTIRSVQITFVIRTGRKDFVVNNSSSFYNQQSSTTAIYTAPGDHYRRRYITAEVQCRNMGLNGTGYGGSMISS